MRRIAVALVLILGACADEDGAVEAADTSGGTVGESESDESTGGPGPTEACALDFRPMSWCEAIAECTSRQCGDRPQQTFPADDIRLDGDEWMRCADTCHWVFSTAYEYEHGNTSCLPLDTARYPGDEEVLWYGPDDIVDPVQYWCTCYRPETTEPFMGCEVSAGEPVADAPSTACYEYASMLRPDACGVVATVGTDGGEYRCWERYRCLASDGRDPSVCHAVYDDACSELGL